MFREMNSKGKIHGVGKPGGERKRCQRKDGRAPRVKTRMKLQIKD